ncbi:MAG: cell division FtsA domain-containing protein [Lachnospiraceae bacterium]
MEKENNLVFGLDIGTRNVVGTVGYKDEEEDRFYVMAQYIRQHKTRAMLDGQIHDIGKVGDTIRVVKEQLQEQTGDDLKEVCIAAAGRVLKTVTTTVEMNFPEETVVTAEQIHTMDLLGIEQAQKILQEKNDTRYRFYCVGYSVVKYYLNDEHFISIESHKAEKIAEDIIVTFLPEDVVDGLYAAVAKAGLEVANLTLEPIAAINIAIPESFRMLNLALVDVGAGTSDISITRDGSIIAYGMIPYAGDEVTELIVQSLLVDFKTAEKIKMDSGVFEEVEYKDIMGIVHKVPAKEIWDMLDPVVEKITTAVADRIRELNGDSTVAATFVVGGGGKVHGFTEKLADKLDLPHERVALRGEEVLQEVEFEQEDIEKDPLLVTPIGICLNYYEQKNNFIMVHFNGERVKLYDNNKLTIVDAAMEAGFPNDQLFPRSGKALTFTVNGKKRIVRGEVGESAVVKVNGNTVSISEPLEPNSYITMEPSTAGEPAKCTIEDLNEYSSCMARFIVNGKVINCPKFMEVNGTLEPPFYEIQDGDVIESRNYYTISQLAEFMDVKIDRKQPIYVNNEQVTTQALVYENFTVEWTVQKEETGTDDAQTHQTSQDILRSEEEKDEQEKHIGAGAKRQMKEMEDLMADLPEEEQEALEELGDIEDPVEYVDSSENKKDTFETYADELEELGRYVDEMNKAEEESEQAKAHKKPVIEDYEEEPQTDDELRCLDALEDEQDVLDEEEKLDLNPTFTFVTPEETEFDEPEPEVDDLEADEPEPEADDFEADEPELEAEGFEADEPEPEVDDFEADEPEADNFEVDEPEPEADDFEEGETELDADDFEEDEPELEADDFKGDEEDLLTADFEEEYAETIADDQEEKYAEEEALEADDLADEDAYADEKEITEETQEELLAKKELCVLVNQKPITLTGKREYIFVDIFQFFDFDLSDSRGRAVITKINGVDAQFSQKLKQDDRIEVYWKEN